VQQVFGTAETNPRLSAVRSELTELLVRQQKLEQIYSGRKALLSQMAFVKKEIQVGSAASLLSAVQGRGVSALLTVEFSLGVSFSRWGVARAGSELGDRGEREALQRRARGGPALQGAAQAQEAVPPLLRRDHDQRQLWGG
jgi:hypothetical protein